MNVNIVNNYYKPGPGTMKRGEKVAMRIAAIGVRTTKYTKHDTDQPNRWDPSWHRWGKYFIDGNVNDRYGDVTDDNWEDGVLAQTENDEKNDFTFKKVTQDTIQLKEPIPALPTTTHDAKTAYERVLSYAGASLHRDWVDELMVIDTRHGTATHTGILKDKKGKNNIPGIIDSQDDNRPADAPADWDPWPVLKSEPAPADTDGDGMPDEWEKVHGLNPNDATDGNNVTADGYTNLEVYMNSIVADIVEAKNKM